MPRRLWPLRKYRSWVKVSLNLAADGHSVFKTLLVENRFNAARRAIAAFETAKRRARETRQLWESSGSYLVDDATLFQAASNARCARDEREKTRRPGYWQRRIGIHYLRFASFARRIVSKCGLEWPVAAVFIAAATFAMTVPIALLSSESLAFVFGIGAIVFAMTLGLLAILMLLPSQQALPALLGGWGKFLDERNREYDTANKSYRALVMKRERLLRLKRLQENYERADREYQRLRQLNQVRRHRLLIQDWRSLRGVAFEVFLFEVFTELGYIVTMTKASGDQGVDLTAIKAQRRVAIQAKGYSGSVGNPAVQQVFAGKEFYGCFECAVVTNSSFTRGARELALSVNCHLIDEAMIPELIDGHIF